MILPSFFSICFFGIGTEIEYIRSSLFHSDITDNLTQL